MAYVRFSAKKKRAKVLWLPVFLLGFLLLSAFFGWLRLSEAAEGPAKAAISTGITQTVEEAIRRFLSEEPFASPVTLSRDMNGNITALETDAAAIALLHARITQTVIDGMPQESRTVRVPFGDLSQNPLFSGRGPTLSVRFTAAPDITCQIENEFYESGINQTMHRVVAHIRVAVYARLPLRAQRFTVDVPYCLAETVIVGKVPDAYTRINRFADDISESEIDDIYDFGAELP